MLQGKKGQRQKSDESDLIGLTAGGIRQRGTWASIANFYTTRTLLFIEGHIACFYGIDNGLIINT
jgi:hypothetical protein